MLEQLISFLQFDKINTFKDFIVIAMPHILSVICIWSIYLQGNISKLSWLVTIINQLLWLVWIYVTKSYGFALMNLAIMLIAFRNYCKWRKLP